MSLNAYDVEVVAMVDGLVIKRCDLIVDNPITMCREHYGLDGYMHTWDSIHAINRRGSGHRPWGTYFK